jgi:hypothetical protein
MSTDVCRTIENRLADRVRAGIRSGALTFEGGHRRVEAHTPLDAVVMPRLAK